MTDPMLDHLRRGGTVHFAAGKDAPSRCGRPAKAATNCWPAVTCRKCQAWRSKAEGNVRAST